MKQIRPSVFHEAMGWVRSLHPPSRYLSLKAIIDQMLDDLKAKYSRLPKVGGAGRSIKGVSSVLFQWFKWSVAVFAMVTLKGIRKYLHYSVVAS